MLEPLGDLWVENILLPEGKERRRSARIEDKKFNRFDCIRGAPDGRVIATILVNAKDRDQADVLLKEAGEHLQEYLETDGYRKQL